MNTVRVSDRRDDWKVAVRRQKFSTKSLTLLYEFPKNDPLLYKLREVGREPVKVIFVSSINESVQKGTAESKMEMHSTC